MKLEPIKPAPPVTTMVLGVDVVGFGILLLLEGYFRFGEGGMILIFITKDEIAIKFGPIDGDIRVVIHNATFVLWVIDIVAFISKFGIVAKDEKAMGESARNHELLMILLGEAGANPLTVGGATVTEINGNIENFAF